MYQALDQLPLTSAEVSSITSGMEYEVLVQLKGEVLDPEGRAIQETLKAQGIKGVAAIQVAKRFVISFDPNQSKNASDVDHAVRDIAERYLANPVAQTFTVKRLS